MLALKVMQKDAEMYLVSYPARDLLGRVKFETRAVEDEKETRGPDRARVFIDGVVKSDQGFQRKLIHKKVRAISEFVRLCEDQPAIPSTVLLYTPEKLRFRAQGPGVTVGDLSEPEEPFTVVDGQHRLAGLRMHLLAHPEDADSLHVPVAVFDGKSAHFAAEMFVIVNSTHSKIAKSLLVDLMDQVRTANREELVTARVVKRLYLDAASPLRYRINRLGGRSAQDKWILQSQLYAEISRLLSATKPVEHRKFVLERLGLEQLGEHPHTESEALQSISDRIFTLLADWYRACAQAFGESWGGEGFMVTSPATLQALTRLLGDQLRSGSLVDHYLESGQDASVFGTVLDQAFGRSYVHFYFREGSFSSRFPARTAIERVKLIHEWLGTEFSRAHSRFYR
jgi:DGQHR domain-containing protein